MNITADHIENLYNHGGELELPNGDTLNRDALVQYIDACDIDTDDDGTPLDSQWQILADVLGAPDPANMPELVDVATTTNSLREAVEQTYVATLEDHHGAITIVVRDLTAEDTIDTTSIATFDALGIFTGGLRDTLNVKTAAVEWLYANGWETVADRTDVAYGGSWRLTEPLPVRPAPADDLSHVAVAASRIGQAEEARDKAIRKALDAGHAVIPVAKAADLSRARIYQIRDGRR